MNTRSLPWTIGLVALAALGAPACKRAGSDVPLAKKTLLADEAADDGTIPNVPVPAEGGAKLLALRADVPVLERPKKDAPVIGALRFGAAVARAAEPFKRTNECEGGYYPVRPRGFVCADAGVALDAEGDLVKPPAAEQALPYRYAVATTATPLYARVPTVTEQIENEPSLERHLGKLAKAAPKTLKAGANDVPLDERAVPTGVALLAKSAQGLGADGKRTSASYFDASLDATPPIVPERQSGPPVAMVLRKGSGVALVGVTTLTGPSGPRRFGITPDANLVPLDRVDPALGSTWHGVDLTKEKGLPIGFVLRHEVCPYALSKAKARRLEDDEVERRSHVYLTGRFRTVDNVRYEETEDGVWFREKDLIKVVKRTKFPDFVSEGSKWIDVSIALQTMTLYEGKKPVYTTLISSGKDMLGDPATTASTQLGVFTLQKKAITLPLDAREVEQAYDVQHAPWGLELAPGVAIVGSYWSDPGGEARMFHNIAVNPVDAHRVFVWAGPEVPTGFRWIAPRADETITVSVRK